MSVSHEARTPTAAEIETMIVDRTRGAIEELQVEVGHKSIILSGRTNFWFLKQLAQQVVLELPIAEDLVNDIEVK